MISTARALDLELAGVLDQARREGEEVMEVPLVGDRHSYVRHLTSHHFFVAIGDNHARLEHFQSIVDRGGELACLVHPDAHLDPSSSAGRGTILARGSMVCPNGRIGENVIINSRALVEHDAEIGDHVHIGPDATLAGKVKVGEGSFCGLRSVVRDGIEIGSWCTIGAGAVVVADVPDGATVIGNPGRIVGMDPSPGEMKKHPNPLVKVGVPLQEVLEEIDFFGTGYAMVVDEQQRCVGLVTDGMIRRHILRKGAMEAKVEDFMNRKFVHLQDDQEREAPKLFSPRVHFIPVLDKDARLVRILHRSDFFLGSRQEGSEESRQVRDIFRWITNRSSSRYSKDAIQGELKREFEPHNLLVDGGAQNLLEVLGDRMGFGRWSPAAAQWWDSTYTSVRESAGEGEISLAGEAQSASQAPRLILCGRREEALDHLEAFPKDLCLLRCGPEDEINLEGAGLLLSTDPLDLPTRAPHVLQWVSGLAGLRRKS